MDFNPSVHHMCPFCSYGVADEYMILVHIKQIHPEESIGSSDTEEASLECPVCLLEFDTVEILNKHIDDVHWDQEEKDIQDIQIVRVSTNEEPAITQPSQVKQDIELIPHPQNNEVANVSPKSPGTDDASESIFPCMVCGKEFDSQKVLIKHFEAHYTASKKSFQAVDIEPSEKVDHDSTKNDNEKIKCDSRKSDLEKSKIPALTDNIIFRGEPVDFLFLLLEMCVTTARENVYEAFKNDRLGKPIIKWSRAHAIELLEKEYPEAQSWNRATLLERMAKAENAVRQLKMTKTEAHKTGMGSMDTLNDLNMMPRGKKSNYKCPSTDREKMLTKMIEELDQIRENLKELTDRSGAAKTNKSTKHHAVKNVDRNKKANSFLNSLGKRSSVKTQVDELEDTLSDENMSNNDLDKLLDPIPSGSKKIKSGTLVGRSAAKVQEADELRRSSVQALTNKVSIDDDQALETPAGGLGGLMNSLNQLIQQDLNGDSGSSDEKLRMLEQKLEQKIDQNKKEMQNQIDQNQRETEAKLQQNQNENNTRFDGIEDKQDQALEILKGLKRS